MTTETDAGAAQAATEEAQLQAIADHGKEAAQPAEKPTDDAKPEGDDDTGNAETDPNADKGEGDAPKPKKTAKERIDELTWRLRETERREAALLDRLTSGKPPAQEPQSQPAQAETEPPPNPDDYVYGEQDIEFVKDTARYEARQEFKTLAAQAAERTAAEKAGATYAEKEAAFAATNPDYQQIVVEGAKADKWACTDHMNQAIRTSEDGPKLAYYLATHPDEARQIADLTPIAQVRELGKLEAKLSTPPKPQAKTATDAPEPPPAVRGASGRFEVQPDTDDFAAFEKLADQRLRA